MHFKVVFNLDGSGVYYDINEPIHLDALLAWALVPMQGKNGGGQRGDIPDDIKLPLLRSRIYGSEVWHASALFPDGVGREALRVWRKKFRECRSGLVNGNPNLRNGIYREYNMPTPLLLVERLICYASGSRRHVKKILKKHVVSLGKKRSQGHGRISSIDCFETIEDWSIVKDGRAMRWIPKRGALRMVRPSPPYWSSVGRVSCCEVGDVL